MKFLIIFISSIFLFILDISFMPFFDINGFYPSLLIIYFIIFCINSDKDEIFYFSIFSGFMQDIYFGNGFGLNIFLNIILGVLCYYVATKYNRNKYFLSVFIISIIYILKSLLISGYLFLFFGIDISILKFIIEFIYLFILVSCFYPLVDKLFKSKLWKKSLEF